MDRGATTSSLTDEKAEGTVRIGAVRRTYFAKSPTMTLNQRRIGLCGFLAVPALAASCAPRPSSPASTVSQAWEHRRDSEQTALSQDVQTRSQAATRSTTGSTRDSADDEPIALVDGKSISRNQLNSLLIRSRGAAILEQLVGLAAAEAHAETHGVEIGDAEVQFEYELALRRLLDPLATAGATIFDHAEAERLLDAVLEGRFMSRPEYMLTVRRNALLRKIVAAGLTVSDDQLRSEYDIAYGVRLQVRHIQLANLPDATRIMERLTAGEGFAELASRYSNNATTARRGGLLEPFSPRDEDIPAAFRETAAKLKPGEVSGLVRVGEWFHVLKLEKRIPAENHELEEVREVLERRLLVRLTDAKMRTLFEKLMREASVQIADPELRERFAKTHPEITR